MLPLRCLLILVILAPLVAPVAAEVPVASLSGPLVVRVEVGGQAEEAGVLVGDILVSYRDQPIAKAADLRPVIAEGERVGNIGMLVVDRSGVTKRFVFKPGRLGMDLVDIEQGAALPVLPPPTITGLDFSSLASAPRDDWYRVLIDGEHRGFEHNRLALDADGKLEQYSEVAFDGGSVIGIQHFQVRITAAITDGMPILEILRYFVPTTGFELTYRAEQTGTRRGLNWIVRHEGQVENGWLEADLGPDRIVPTWLENLLDGFMPWEEGACLRLRQLMDGMPRLGRPTALVVGPIETITIGDVAHQTRRIDHRFFGGLGNQHWVTAEGRIVRSTYNGAVAEISTRDAALAGLATEILRKAKRD